MAENNSNAKDINILELLMKISNDVSSIKTDMSNFKENQKKDIAGVRDDYKRELSALETTVMSRINGLQSVQNTLVGEVDTLKNADDRKDANKWRRITAYVCTALGGIILAKLPEIIKTLYIVLAVKS